MSHARCSEIVSCLTGDVPPRVWSLLVTVFGDLAQAEGQQISGRALTRLCGAIGIRPEAQRVALHRLRKDGWIESLKNGRERLHALTGEGRRQSALATPRIYGTDPRHEQAWISVYDRAPSDRPEGETGVWVSSSIFVGTAPGDARYAFVAPVTDEAPLPSWMAARICDPETLSHAKEFAARLRACVALRDMQPDLSPLEISVLRVLVVHGWRRIILRVPDLPDHTFPQIWPGPECRELVAQLLAGCPRATLSEPGFT